MGVIRFLHIVKDDKFFKPILKSFEKEEDISSKYIYYAWKKTINFLKDEPDLTIYENRRAFIERLQADDYDVIYLHSLHFSILPFIRHIPKNKIVIWWAWGGDIYDGQLFGLKSYVNINTKKAETERVLKNTRRYKDFVVRILFSGAYSYYRKQALKRIDYFQPVIDIDYSLMKEFTGFKAKEFYTNNWSNFYTGGEVCAMKSRDGSIILGNSASPANNHIDAWKSIKDFIPIEQKVVIPLSYGEMNYAKLVKEEIDDSIHNLSFLDTFLPKKEYFRIIEGCSYAVYGSIRQHAMGNIYNSLKSGLKVFLFRESQIYKYLVGKGFVVFAIEEVKDSSFRSPLSLKDQKTNLEAMKNEQESYREKGRLAFEEIKHRVSDKAKVK